MMTRKDYIVTAEILNQGIPHDYFAKDNPRFDRTRFFTAVKKES
jgi:hypothetical protein